MEGGEAIQQQSESEDRHATLERVPDQRSSGIPASQSRSKGKHERNADNKEEEGENQVGWGPPVPLDVRQRPIGTTVSRSKGKHERNADNKEEEGENQVG